MHHWLPRLRHGLAPDGHTLYWPDIVLVLNGQEDARFGYSYSAKAGDVDKAFTSLEAAVGYLEQTLTRFVRPGDQVNWHGHTFTEVAAAIAGIRANPVEDPYEPLTEPPA